MYGTRMHGGNGQKTTAPMSPRHHPRHNTCTGEEEEDNTFRATGPTATNPSGTSAAMAGPDGWVGEIRV